MKTNFLKIAVIALLMFTSCEKEESAEITSVDEEVPALILGKGLMLDEYTTVKIGKTTIKVDENLSSDEREALINTLESAAHLVYQSASKTILVFDETLTEKQIEHYGELDDDYSTEIHGKSNAWTYPLGYSFTLKSGASGRTYNGRLRRQDGSGLYRKINVWMQDLTKIEYGLRNRANRVLSKLNFHVWSGSPAVGGPVYYGPIEYVVHSQSSWQRKRQPLFTGNQFPIVSYRTLIQELLVEYRHTNQTRY